MKTFLRIVFMYIPSCAAIAVIALVYFATENRPAATAVRTVQTADVARARTLGKRVVEQLFDVKAATTIVLSEKDIDSVFALMSQGIPRLTGDATIAASGLDAAITLRLPKNPFRNYVNLRFGLRPSPRGLDFAATSLGRIALSGATMKTLIRRGLNLMLDDDIGTKIVASVKAVHFRGDVARLRIEPVPDLRLSLNAFFDRLGGMRNEVAFLGDQEVIGIYYTRLVELDYIGKGPGKVSLARIVGPLFTLVKDRSGFGDPVVENQAALLAMVMYFGDARFERLTGPVRRGVLEGHIPRKAGVRLGGRGDLLLHFVISAGLKLVSDRGIAMAIGEFKELLDSGKGGSGFSFVDLAADRAGLRFAEVATDGDGSARHLQNVLAGKAVETAFFPRFTDLPEGIPEAAFKRDYGDVNDPRYVELVAEIDKRLAGAQTYRVLLLQ